MNQIVSRQYIKTLKVQDLLASPKSWTQFCTARDANGYGTMSQHKDAVAWCLLGAIIKCYAGADCDCTRPEFQRVVARVCHKIRSGVMGWNDAPHRSHAQVLRLCEELDI